MAAVEKGKLPPYPSKGFQYGTKII